MVFVDRTGYHKVLIGQFWASIYCCTSISMSRSILNRICLLHILYIHIYTYIYIYIRTYFYLQVYRIENLGDGCSRLEARILREFQCKVEGMLPKDLGGNLAKMVQQVWNLDKTNSAALHELNPLGWAHTRSCWITILYAERWNEWVQSYSPRIISLHLPSKSTKCR